MPSEPTIPTVTGLDEDPEVYEAVKRLALATVDAAIDILDTAAPQQQQQMIRIMLPRLTGGLSKKKGDDNGGLRKALDDMHAAIEASFADPSGGEQTSPDGEGLQVRVHGDPGSVGEE